MIDGGGVEVEFLVINVLVHTLKLSGVITIVASASADCEEDMELIGRGWSCPYQAGHTAARN